MCTGVPHRDPQKLCQHSQGTARTRGRERELPQHPRGDIPWEWGQDGAQRQGGAPLPQHRAPSCSSWRGWPWWGSSWHRAEQGHVSPAARAVPIAATSSFPCPTHPSAPASPQPNPAHPTCPKAPPRAPRPSPAWLLGSNVGFSWLLPPLCQSTQFPRLGDPCGSLFSSGHFRVL